MKYLEVNLRSHQALEIQLKNKKRDKVPIHKELEESVAQLYFPGPRIVDP